jgi:hypothetical protein
MVSFLLGYTNLLTFDRGAPAESAPRSTVVNILLGGNATVSV